MQILFCFALALASWDNKEVRELEMKPTVEINRFIINLRFVEINSISQYRLIMY